MSFIKKVTRVLAEDIHRQRKLSNKPKKISNDEVLIIENLREIKSMKKREYLKETLKLINNPFEVFVVMKNDGLKGVFKILLAPIALSVVHNSVLSPKTKISVDFKLNSMLNNINLKEVNNIKLNNELMIKA